MRVTILGCGTSTGVPVIGCRCSVCTSGRERNLRKRSSALVQSNGVNILLDTSTDLRAQALGAGLDRVDAVLFTHPHADHIHGIDELRAFNLAQGSVIPCFGNSYTIERIRRVFDYIFTESEYDGWKPRLATTVVGEGEFEAAAVKVLPVEILHGKARILGYRIGPFAYLTDCSGIPEGSFERLKGLDLLVLGALRRKPHPSHFSIDEAVEAAGRIAPGRTLLTHLSHNVDYYQEGPELPEGVELAYDGLTVEL